jgi:hypothetical protein
MIIEFSIHMFQLQRNMSLAVLGMLLYCTKQCSTIGMLPQGSRYAIKFCKGVQNVEVQKCV